MTSSAPDPPKEEPPRGTIYNPADYALKKPLALMTRRQGTAIIILLLALVVFAFWPALKPAPKWEYKIESIPDIGFDLSMATQGNEGWELVFARRASSGTEGDSKPVFSYEMIFKRPAR